MQLAWTTIRVQDVTESLHFYHEILGLPIASRHGSDTTEVIMLGPEDQPKVELLWQNGAQIEAPNGSMTIGFLVDSLEDALERMKQHDISILREPYAPNPHIWFFFVKDPDGYEVQIAAHR